MKQLFLFLFFLSLPLRAQDAVDENALFSDTAISSSEPLLVSIPKATSTGAKSVTFNGSLISKAQGGLDQGFWDARDAAHTSFSSGLTGDLMLDVRLPQGVKAYGALETQYQPVPGDSGAPSATFAIPELFVDARLGSKVFLRTGKQVVQAGRCYLWNPTDLINIERKTFEPKIGLREGAYGIKLQIPVNTRLNLSGFLGMDHAARLDSLSATVKTEVLIGNTEMGVSLYGKQGKGPVFGYDLSTRALGLDINAEAVLYQRFSVKGVTFDSGPPQIISEERNWVPRLAVNAGRSFTVNSIPDRLRAIAEIYINPAGNNLRAVPLDRLPDSLRTGAGSSSGSSDFIRRIVETGLYEPNSFSQYYAALLVSLDQCLLPEISASLGALNNLTERCSILALFLTYKNRNGFSLALNLYEYAGPINTEYTIPGSRTSAQLTARLDF